MAIQASGSITPGTDVISPNGAGDNVTTAIASLTSNTPGVACSPVTEFYNTGQTSTAVTTTSASLAHGAVSVTVNSVASITVGNYIQMGTEDMLVTAVNTGTKTLTLVRAAVGTTENAGTYASGTSVYIPAIDYLYLSVTENGNVTDGALACSGACLYSIAVGTSSASYATTGMAPANGLGAAGGTSGIIIDNTVPATTQVGAEQIYYNLLSGTTSNAIQASQSAP